MKKQKKDKKIKVVFSIGVCAAISIIVILFVTLSNKKDEDGNLDDCESEIVIISENSTTSTFDENEEFEYEEDYDDPTLLSSEEMEEYNEKTKELEKDMNDTSPQITYNQVDLSEKSSVLTKITETNQWKSYSFLEYYIPIDQFYFIESNGYYQGTYANDDIYIVIGYEFNSDYCTITVSEAGDLNNILEYHNKDTENYPERP